MFCTSNFIGTSTVTTFFEGLEVYLETQISFLIVLKHFLNDFFLFKWELLLGIMGMISTPLIICKISPIMLNKWRLCQLCRRCLNTRLWLRRQRWCFHKHRPRFRPMAISNTLDAWKTRMKWSEIEQSDNWFYWSTW